ncbi:hypothetical protein CCACVL1_17969 [Corchorus capsularis]|uniref:Uncharacterized protein n=1 Tax=Corchorus capsularis TaxID=210143 RepID=A0A1R3HP77_COCAP|nr:hypothetical protein CCACVL1_17969 [Corchorus capsularis]
MDRVTTIRKLPEIFTKVVATKTKVAVVVDAEEIAEDTLIEKSSVEEIESNGKPESNSAAAAGSARLLCEVKRAWISRKAIRLEFSSISESQ